jgi:hypothetical protein
VELGGLQDRMAGLNVRSLIQTSISEEQDSLLLKIGKISYQYL